jgi:putative N6-adenine-specific DNA methylase
VVSQAHDLFAVALPGLEPLVAAELAALGLAAVAVEDGGVAFRGTLGDGLRANLESRLATRVLLRLGAFAAGSPAELERGLRALPWGRVLRAETPVTVRVASHGSRLRGPALERIARRRIEAARDHRPRAAGGPQRPGGSPPAPAAGPAAAPFGSAPQEILIRVVDDRCVVSADLSGERLDRRGYRTLASRAPLRETLAAAVLTLAGWSPTQPLVDPFCGSGTFVIEAARQALGVPPGLGRTFALESWPSWDPAEGERLRAAAAAACRERPPAPLWGRDADERVVAAARANARAAGVASAVDLAPGEVAALAPPNEGPGLVVANPPYGKRLGTRGSLRPLYRQLGGVLASRFAGWRAAVLCPDRALERELRLLVTARHALPHGGLRVDLLLAAL